MDDFLFWTLVLFLVVFNLWQRRGRGASIANRETAQALYQWMEDHPGLPLSYPSAQALLQERLRAWRAYVKAYPVMNDGGKMEQYLLSELNEEFRF